MERRVYYFNTTWCCIFLIFGSLCIWGAIYTIKEVPFYPFTSFYNWFINIAVSLLLSGMFLIGLLCLIAVLTSKIVVSSEGIEYHSASSVAKYRWIDVKVHIPKNSSIESVSLHVSNPEIHLRFWTHFVPWDAEKGARYNLKHGGIPISQFGGFAPSRLVDDIRRFSSNEVLEQKVDELAP
jgi:hypothetical protein